MSQVLPERRSTTVPERWEPLSELEQVTQRMRRMLDQTFGGVGWPSPLLTQGAGWSPRVNIEVVGNELSIAGEIKERERKGAVRKRTRRTGRFDYHVRLPDQVDASKIDASLDQGVLAVRVPKVERAKRQKIQIKSK